MGFLVPMHEPINLIKANLVVFLHMPVALVKWGPFT